MRVLNEQTKTKQSLMIRLLSDNYECWCTCKAYKEITLQMSTGDHGVHKAIGLWVDCQTEDGLKNRVLVEHINNPDTDEMIGLCYWDNGDYRDEYFESEKNSY